MNNMFSKAAIWVVIALVLFMVFKQFDSRSMATNAKAIAYSDFISEVKAGHIKDATIEDRTIVATTQDGTKVKTAATIWTAAWSATCSTMASSSTSSSRKSSPSSRKSSFRGSRCCC